MPPTRTPLVVSGLFLLVACAAGRGAEERSGLWPSNGYRLTSTWRVSDPTAAADDADDEAEATLAVESGESADAPEPSEREGLEEADHAPKPAPVASTAAAAPVVADREPVPAPEGPEGEVAPRASSIAEAEAAPDEDASAEGTAEGSGDASTSHDGDESAASGASALAQVGEAAPPPPVNVEARPEGASASAAPFFLRAEALCGRVILGGDRDEEMRQIGTLRDLVVDPETGEIAKAILAIGESDGQVLVPFDRLFWDAGATMRLLMGADELQNATWLRWPGIEHDWSKVFEGRDLVKLGGKIEEKTILRLEAGNDLVLLRLVEENNHRHRVLLAPSRFLESVRLEKGDSISLDAVETRDPKGRLMIASRIKAGTIDLVLRDPTTGETAWKAADEMPASASPACWPPLDDEYKLVPAHELSRNAVVYDAAGETARVSGVLFGAPFAVERYLTIHFEGREFPLPWEFVRPHEPTQALQDQGVHVGFATSLTLALLTNMDPLPADTNDRRFWLDAHAHFEELRKVQQGMQAAEALSALEATSHP